jgi:hypothetical protein
MDSRSVGRYKLKLEKNDEKYIKIDCNRIH